MRSMSLSHGLSAAVFVCGFAAVAQAADSGTGLSTTGTLVSIACINDNEATVTVTSQLNSTGSVDSADVTLSIDGAAAISVGTIYPGDFVHDGRIKTAAYSDTLTLANGTHTLTYCFIQSGSRGREPKTTCFTLDNVVVDCAPEDRCGEAEVFFGNVPNNPVLLVCTGKANPHIPVHVKSSADEVELTITGPGGFTLTTLMNRAGESCVHQFNWRTLANNGGAGTYTLTARNAATGELLGELTREIGCR